MMSPDALDHQTPPRPQPADVSQAIASALAPGGSTDALERVVRSYVRALRAAEVPPEKALMRVKSMVPTSTVTPLPVRGARSSASLADDVMAWFVAEYYRAD
jgi:hypothetical protein